MSRALILLTMVLFILSIFLSVFEKDILNGYFYILNLIYGTQYSYQTVFINSHLLEYKIGMDLSAAEFLINIFKQLAIFFLLVVILGFARVIFASILHIKYRLSNKFSLKGILVYFTIWFVFFFLTIVIIDLMFRSINLY